MKKAKDMNVYVRKLCTSDLIDINEIYKEEYGHPFKMDNKNSLVAIYKTRALGCLEYIVCPDSSIYIKNIVIDKKYRRKGIGSALFVPITIGRKIITMKVGEYNLGGQLFLKFLGFKWIETISGVEDTYLMRYMYDKSS